MSRIGVLALRGGYGAHMSALTELGHEALEVQGGSQLMGLDGLILPGGESSAQLKLIQRNNWGAALSRFVSSGRPVLATCAGLILAARCVKNPAQPSFGWLAISVVRNAWGRQIHSFHAQEDEIETSLGLESPTSENGIDADAARPGHCREPNPRLPLMFIRAPTIVEVGVEVRVLLRFQREPVLVRQGNVYGATFHPELTPDRRLHALIFGDGAGQSSG